MLAHAFRRRREIERMLLSGKKLTVSELMGRYCVGRKSISRDFEVIGEELPVISKQGYNRCHRKRPCQPGHRGQH